MPRDLIVTAPELSTSMQQLGVADEPAGHDARAERDERTLYLEIVLTIEMASHDLKLALAGSITLRVRRA